MKLKKLIAGGLFCAVIGSMAIAPMAQGLPSYEYGLAMEAENKEGFAYGDDSEELGDSYGDRETQLEKKAASLSVEKKKQKAKKKRGWITKGKHRYYRMKNGKLCKKKFVKLGKYYYSFDSKGRMRTGNVKFGDNDVRYFSKKTGRYMSASMVLRVKKIYKSGEILCKNSRNELYRVPMEDVVITNKKGKRLKASAIKKNSRIKVLYGGLTREIYPGEFDEVGKIIKL